MKIRDLYRKYNLMPQLIEHQLRVGAIAQLITNDKEVVLTALVHDMENMAKFKLKDPYWIKEQVKFRAKYGNDAHIASILILKEAGLLKYAQLLNEEANFYKDILNVRDFRSIDLAAIITLYADSRVAIGGVVSIEERIVDLETRYQMKRNDRLWASKLEDYVQSLSKVDVVAITEADVKPLFGELLEYEI